MPEPVAPHSVRDPSDPITRGLNELSSSGLPNVFLVGAMKSGTSWLAKQLAAHPEVFLPAIKEPNLLAKPAHGPYIDRGPLARDELIRRMHWHSARTVEDYTGCFADARDVPVRIDASIRYFMSDLAAERIAALPHPVKILVILRDPVERLWSHWQMHRAMGIERLKCRDAVQAEPERLARGWSRDWAYQGYSQYDGQLDRYIRLFGRERIHVEIYEEAVADPHAALGRVFAFLGLDPDRAQATDVHQMVRPVSPVASTAVDRFARHFRPRWREALPRTWRHRAWLLLQRLNRRKRPRKVPRRLRRELSDRLAPSAAATAGLLGRELPWPTVRGHR